MPDPPPQTKKTTTTATTTGTIPTPTPRRTRSILSPIPEPFRRLFSHFPCVTYPPNTLPARCPDEDSRASNTLYVFSTPEQASLGSPSYNPTCLKWQTLLRLAGVEFDVVTSSNHASPTGALPFMIPSLARPRGREGEKGGTDARAQVPLHHRTVIPVTAGRLEDFALDYQQDQGCEDADGHDEKAATRRESGSGQRRGNGKKRIRDISTLQRAAVYQSLIDTRIRNAWLHTLYLSPPNTPLLKSLYIHPMTTSSLARISTLHSLRRAAEVELLKAVPGSAGGVIDVDAIYRSAAEAVQALEIVLGENRWFFEGENSNSGSKGGKRDDEAAEEGDEDEALPSFFDAAVFAYTHLLLDPGMEWGDRRLVELVEGSEVLRGHRVRVLEATGWGTEGSGWGLGSEFVKLGG